MRFQKFLGPRERFASADPHRQPQVSVIMPTSCGNRQSRLQRAIDSVLAQSVRNIELAIVDDGSSDGTEAICRSYAVRDPRVVYVRYKEPCGLPALRVDAAIVGSRAPFVGLMFDDHVWTADALESLLAIMESSKVDVLHGRVESTSKTGDRLMLGTGPLCSELLTCQNTIPSAAVLCRRDFFDRFGLFDPHLVLRRTCDWDLWLRAIRLGAVLGQCDKTVARQQGPLLLAADANPAAWDHKTSFAYMTCTRQLLARTKSLVPENIDRYDVFDRQCLTPYLRSGHEWKVAQKLIYEPYFEAHPHYVASAGQQANGKAVVGNDTFPHGVKERMRVLLVSNVYHDVVHRWQQKLTAQGHAIVVCCAEWQASLFPPGDVDLLVLFDCASPKMLDVVVAHAAAGVPITYCTVFGEGERQGVAQAGNRLDLAGCAKLPEIPSAMGDEFYFGQPGAAWNRAQRVIADRLKSRANCVLNLGGDGRQAGASTTADAVAWS